MRPLTILMLLSLTLQGCSSGPKNNNKMGFFYKLFGNKDSANQSTNKTVSVDKTKQAYDDYQNKLLATKNFYPFKKWRESYEDGLTQYTEENCKKIEDVFDDLIDSLIYIGANANESQKIELFKKAILDTNKLNEEIDGLIETGEREDLSELTNKITIACGLDPKKFGDGEGLASEWREW